MAFDDFLSGASGGLETGIMAGVLTGNPILGVAAGGLGFLSSMFQSRSRRKAAGRLAAANREAARYQYAAAMKSLDMWNGYLTQMTQQFKPWRVAGLAAMDEMMRGVGIVVPEGTFDIGPDWTSGITSGNVAQMLGAVQNAGQNTAAGQQAIAAGFGRPTSVTGPGGGPATGHPQSGRALGMTLGHALGLTGTSGIGHGSPGVGPVGGHGSPSVGFGTAAGAGT